MHNVFPSYLKSSTEVDKAVACIQGRLVHDGGDWVRRRLWEDLVDVLWGFLSHFVIFVSPTNYLLQRRCMSFDVARLEKRHIMETHPGSGYANGPKLCSQLGQPLRPRQGG